MAARDEGFLHRWSRLKTAQGEARETAEQGEEKARTLDAAREPAAGAAADPAVATDVATDALPRVEDLTGESDFAAFMGEGVPDEIRNLALRKLWRSDPVLANLDGLNDYDEDFAGAVAIGEEAMRRLVGEPAGEDEAPVDTEGDEDDAEPGREDDTAAAPEPGDEDTGTPDRAKK